MLLAILLILVLFWFMGYGPFEAVRIRFFRLGPEVITLWDILIFLLIIWLIDLLPRPLREIAIVLLLIWLLSMFGILTIVGLNNIIIWAIIIGLLLYILSGRR